MIGYQSSLDNLLAGVDTLGEVIIHRVPGSEDLIGDVYCTYYHLRRIYTRSCEFLRNYKDASRFLADKEILPKYVIMLAELEVDDYLSKYQDALEEL